ncbi:unnamed protein product [Cuscuta campestris]|uniref:Uncharacterized protein n=1 Tax=Cuscuta campestris TaxID=132261 RepID=A0A484M3S5_9ASTE|nr:unnamed protein product [Cuscuta campestris]
MGRCAAVWRTCETGGRVALKEKKKRKQSFNLPSPENRGIPPGEERRRAILGFAQHGEDQFYKFGKVRDTGRMVESIYCGDLTLGRMGELEMVRTV